MYNHSSFAMSAPNILRSRGETVPIGRTFPGNIPGEYESDQEDEHGYHGTEGGPGIREHHLVTPYYPSAYDDRSRQTSGSTSTSQAYPHLSPSYSIPSSHRTLPNLTPSSGPLAAFGQYRSKKARRPGTGSTIGSTGTGTTVLEPATPSSTRSPLSRPRTRLGSQPQQAPPVLSSGLYQPAATTELQSQSRSRPQNVSTVSPHATSAPTLSKRLAMIHSFLTSSQLSYDRGVEGVQEWAEFWVGRGVRVRDLTRDLNGLIKGAVSPSKTCEAGYVHVELINRHWNLPSCRFIRTCRSCSG